jgi:hypothetical protein
MLQEGAQEQERWTECAERLEPGRSDDVQRLLSNSGSGSGREDSTSIDGLEWQWII